MTDAASTARKASLAVVSVAIAVIAATGGGCSEDAPVDGEMRAANEVVSRYCMPFPGRAGPAAGDVRAALASIAKREDDPTKRFRIDDSEEATTAGELLDNLTRYKEEPKARCDRIAGAIERARTGAPPG